MIRFVVPLALPFALVATAARAADEATTLETQLGRETTELSTSDCTVACKALTSIRRAADRICELEPGPRCTAAREKADAATKRVRDACPDCSITALPSPEPHKEERAYTVDGAPKSAPASPTSVPAESERGGCRSCATTPEAPSSGDLWLFVAVAALFARRRPKQKNRS